MSEVNLPFDNKIVTVKTLENMRTKALNNLEEFWSEQAKTLDWFRTWEKVLDDSNPPFYRWFVGGKLNASYNALDRHINTAKKNMLAYIWEGELGEVKKYTFYELYKEVNRFAKILKDQGLKKGDRVVFYMPMIPELPIALLATVRLGAIHTVVFSGFSAEALAGRVNDSEATILITSDGAYRRGKKLKVKETADRALENCPSVKTVIVAKRTDQPIPMKEGRDYWYNDLMAKIGQNVYVKPEPMDSSDPLFILYTSGTTGKPKGVQHGTGGYMVWTSSTLKWAFNLTEKDVWWCTADIGWITGHSYNMYAPLALGVTSLLYEGAPDYPAQDRWWDMVERHGVTVLYSTPTAIRMFMGVGEGLVKKHDLSTLRLLGTVGEPINPEAWNWFYRVIGNSKIPIIDTWWQTETGGFMIAPQSGVELVPLKPGSATYPMPGVNADVYDEDGKSVAAGVKGYLVIKSPWPGMLETLWHDPERYKETYFGKYKNIYYTGDYAVKDPDGYFWLLGRADEVLKVAGHRLGTVEIESALVTHPAVSEAAVMGKADQIKGEVPVAFVVLSEGFTASDDLSKQLIQHVRETIGPIAKPDSVIIVGKLPKTRSGKIMRRLLKAIVSGDELGDVSTLEDSTSVHEIKATFDELQKKKA